VFGHILRHFCNRYVRTKRARPGPHRLLHPQFVTLVQFLCSKQTKNNLALVHDHARVPACLADAVADLPEAFVKVARRYVRSGHVGGAGAAGVSTLGALPRSQPVQLSLRIVIDRREPKSLEPRRGPRAEVSSAVPAVDYDRPVLIEDTQRL
jgi:hypothetical protein